MPRRCGTLALGVLLCAGAARADAPAATSPIAQMLDALRAAPDPHTAEVLETRLQRAWLRAGSPAVTLLISRGSRLLEAKEYDGAAEAFSDAITLQPDLAEAWHQRAVARYQAGDVAGAFRDLEEAIRLEPRDFAAYRTLAEIAMARQDWKGAYAAWQRVMELDPQTPGGAERMKLLKRKALGEET